jgi:hypothetical protein
MVFKELKEAMAWHGEIPEHQGLLTEQGQCYYYYRLSRVSTRVFFNCDLPNFVVGQSQVFFWFSSGEFLSTLITIRYSCRTRTRQNRTFPGQLTPLIGNGPGNYQRCRRSSEKRRVGNVKYDDDGTRRHDHARRRDDGHWDAGRDADGDAGQRELDDGSALYHEVREVCWRYENDLPVRRPDGLQHDAKPLQHDGWRNGQLLRDDERYDRLLLQPDDGHVQGRDDQGRLLRDLHQR